MSERTRIALLRYSIRLAVGGTGHVFHGVYIWINFKHLRHEIYIDINRTNWAIRGEGSRVEIEHPQTFSQPLWRRTSRGYGTGANRNHFNSQVHIMGPTIIRKSTPLHNPKTTQLTQRQRTYIVNRPCHLPVTAQTHPVVSSAPLPRNPSPTKSSRSSPVALAQYGAAGC